jgi:hypothetical protein
MRPKYRYPICNASRQYEVLIGLLHHAILGRGRAMKEDDGNGNGGEEWHCPDLPGFPARTWEVLKMFHIVAL